MPLSVSVSERVERPAVRLRERSAHSSRCWDSICDSASVRMLIVSEASSGVRSRSPSHVFFGGMIYPPELRDNGVPGFVIGEEERGKLMQRLVGCPITYNHLGVVKAVSRIGENATKTEILRSMQQNVGAAEKPVGLVVDAWVGVGGACRCAFVVNQDMFPRLCAMIESGSARVGSA